MKANAYARIVQKAIGQPVFIAENKATVIMDALILPLLLGAEPNRDYVQDEERLEVRSEAGKIIAASNRRADNSNKIGIINVLDTLQNRSSWGLSGGTSYDGIRRQLEAHVSEGTKTIGFFIDSPGGEAAGLFPLTSYIQSLNSQGIFTFSFTDSLAASAAYGIMSATSYATAVESSMVGSIGSLMVHVESSIRDAAQGLTYTIFRSKELKAIGDGHTPLSDAAKEKFQVLVDSHDALFNNAVIAGRPALSIQDIKGMKADTFLGQEALSRKLIDKVVVDFQGGIAAALEFRDTVWKDQNKVTAKANNHSLNQSRRTVMANADDTLEQELTLLKAENIRLKQENAAAITSAITGERARCLAIFNQTTQLNLPSKHAVKCIEKGHDEEDSLEILTAIAEGLGNQTTINTSENTTTLDPDLDTKLSGKAKAPVNTSERINRLRAAADAAGI